MSYPPPQAYNVPPYGYPQQGPAQPGGMPVPQPYPGAPGGPSPYGYPQPGAPAYPQGGAPPGYPAQGAPPGYPPQGGPPGYPHQGSAPGYPPQGGAPGYPPQGGAPGYPPQGGAPGYPPQGGAPGYPPQGGAPGYPPQAQYQQPAPGYAAPQGYTQPLAPAYGSAPGYPPQQQGYPQAAPAYPGYPPAGAPAPGYPQAVAPVAVGYLQAGYASAPGAVYTGQPPVVLLSQAEAEKCCKDLRDAMKGMGTDEKAIVATICNKTPEQCVQIANQYKALYGKTLADAFKSETSHNFGRVLQGIVLDVHELDAQTIHNAIQGAGTDEDALIEALVGKSSYEIDQIKIAYRRMYGKDLEKEVANDLSGYLKRLFVVLLSAKADPPGTMRDVNADVEALYKAGEKQLGTDEMAFISILLNRSDTHLRAVFDAYLKRYGRSMDQVVKKEFSGDLERALLAIVENARSRPDWLAHEFENSMKGLGTHDNKLIRLCLRYRHPVLRDPIKIAYQNKYGKTLAKRIEGETSGDYRRALIMIVDGRVY